MLLIFIPSSYLLSPEQKQDLHNANSEINLLIKEKEAFETQNKSLSKENKRLTAIEKRYRSRVAKDEVDALEDRLFLEDIALRYA